jgi:hypothetical protein
MFISRATTQIVVAHAPNALACTRKQQKFRRGALCSTVRLFLIELPPPGRNPKSDVTREADDYRLLRCHA